MSSRLARGGCALLYGLLLGMFYVRYVPLVGRFQAALLPLLGSALILTACRTSWGMLYFAFVFPLINSLPYFFGLYDPIPSAPTALLLFLFTFGGHLVHRTIAERTRVASLPVDRSLLLWAGLVVVSSLVTAWRYAHFFPLRADRVYELTVNAHGVTAGGAEMSVIFSALNFLSGLGVFYLLRLSDRTPGFRRAAVSLLIVSTFLALSFGLVQSFGALDLGNHPISIDWGMINATFKDALSFGAYLALVVPLLIIAAVFLRGVPRFAASGSLILIGALLPKVGSKSALLSLAVAVPAVFVLISRRGRKRGSELFSPKRWSFWSWLAAGSVLATFVVAAGLAFLPKPGWITRNITYVRLKNMVLPKTLKGMLWGRVDVLWKLALKMIPETPLTGVGVGAFIIEVSNFSREQNVPLHTPETAENYFLQAAAEFGLFGILVLLAIGVEFFRQIRSVWRGPPSDRNEDMFRLASIIGIGSCFLLFIVHTFAGSYEVKYLIWFLAWILFWPDSGLAGRVTKLGRRAKTGGIVILAAFFGVHLWTATHSLSLERRTPRFGLRQEFGLGRYESTPEGVFRWTRRYACLPLRLSGPILELTLKASHPDIEEKPVFVRLSLVMDFFRTKRALGEIRLDDGQWRLGRFDIRQDAGREAWILIEVSRTWNPEKWKGLPDSRNLGVAVKDIRFPPS